MKRTMPVVAVLALILFLLLQFRGSEDPGSPATPEIEEESFVETPLGAEHVPDETSGVVATTLGGAAAIRGMVSCGNAAVRARIEVRKMPPYARFAPLFPTGPVLASGSSSADGRFLLTGLDLGKYAVSAHLESGAWCWARATCSVGEPLETVQIEITPGDFRLEGRAVRKDGSPVSGTVFAYRGSSMWGCLDQAEVGADGRFLLSGISPPWILLVIIDTGRSNSTFAVHEIPWVGVHTFVTDGGLREFKGRVIDDSSGEPVAGAAVEYSGQDMEAYRLHSSIAMTAVLGSHSSIAMTDAQGWFEYRSPKRMVRCYVRAAGFETAQVATREGEDFVVRLTRSATLSGRVVRQDNGRPVAGVSIIARSPRIYSERKGALAVSDAEGRFSVESRTGRLQLSAIGAGWVSAPPARENRGKRPPDLEPGETREVVLEVVRLETGTVTGKVSDADGRAVAGATVLLRRAGSRKGSAVPGVWADRTICSSSDDGSFRFDCAIPGRRCVITAARPGSPSADSDAFEVGSGEQVSADVTLPRERWLTVRVVEEGSGDPIPSAAVSARQGSRYALPRVFTGEDGRARVGPLGPGSLTLKASHRSYLDPQAPQTSGTSLLQAMVSSAGHLTPDPGPKPQELRIELRKGSFLAGRILGLEALPSEYLSLRTLPVGAHLSPSGLGGEYVSMAEDGRFRGGPLPARKVDLLLTYRKDDKLSVINRWTVKPGCEDLILSIDPEQVAEAEQRRMRIRVTCPDGSPATGMVFLLDRNNPLPSSCLLREGRIELGHLTPGEEFWVEVRRARNAAGGVVGDLISGPHRFRVGNLDLVLPPARSISGRVVGPDGRGVRGVRIEAVPSLPEGLPTRPIALSEYADKTNERGEFVIFGMADLPHRIVPQAPKGYVPALIQEAEAGTTSLVVTLEKGTLTQLKLVGPAGRPVGGARVMVSSATRSGVPRQVTSDDRGIVPLGALDPKTTYHLTILPPSDRTDLADHHLSGWEPRSETVHLSPGALLTGTIRGKHETAAFAVIWWRDTRGVWSRTTALPNGSFLIRSVSTGPVELCAAPCGTTSREKAGPTVLVEAGWRGIVLSTVSP